MKGLMGPWKKVAAEFNLAGKKLITSLFT